MKKQAGARLSLSIKEVDQMTGEDLMPGRGHEAAAKRAEELKSNPSKPAVGGGGGKLTSNPLHPGLTQERLKAMEAEEEVRALRVIIGFVFYCRGLSSPAWLQGWGVFVWLRFYSSCRDLPDPACFCALWA